jgi:Ca-activated chloride channel family protein
MTHTVGSLLAVFVVLSAGCGPAAYVPRRVARPSQSYPDAQIGSLAGSDARPVERPYSEGYAAITETGFHNTAQQPRSTFSVDVDTAAYANVRRFLTYGQRPPADAVRVEELINYFDYDYVKPSGEHPIAVTSELATSPYDDRYHVLRVALSASDPSRRASPPKNLVFLIDVSGSMQHPRKLPLVKESLGLLLGTLSERDRVSMVVYAGGTGVVLSPTPGNQRVRISAAIADLEAGGSTNGASGIELAYQLARQHLEPNAINRVILATDGDFNVGVTSHQNLLALIEQRRNEGVSLTVLGFGMGNLKDDTMELLADHGNGNYAYIDTLAEAQKVLVDEVGSTLSTVAQDTKLQLTWDAASVARYRLIGYENRRLRDEDFADDTKDAGDLGDGHRVTALYEVELTVAANDERPLVTIDVRYKRPGDGSSKLFSRQVRAEPVDFEDASADLRFAAAVAGFGMLLRGSPYCGELDFDDTLRIAAGAVGRDPFGYRRELVDLVAHAKTLYER